MGKRFASGGKSSGGGGGGGSKKSKGPKGKKARAKAKLDRQWGETIQVPKSNSNNADGRDQGSHKQGTRRIGKSRLLASSSSRSATTKQQQQLLLKNKKDRDEPSFHERIQHYKQQQQSENSYYRNNNNARSREYDRMVIDNYNDDNGQDDSDSDESSSNEEGPLEDEVETTMSSLPVTNLLESIQKKVKKRSKKTSIQQHRRDRHEDEDEDDAKMNDRRDDDDDDDASSVDSSESSSSKDDNNANDEDASSSDDEDKDKAQPATTSNHKFNVNINGAKNQIDLYRQRFHPSMDFIKKYMDSMKQSPNTVTTKIPIHDMLELQYTTTTTIASSADDDEDCQNHDVIHAIRSQIDGKNTVPSDSNKKKNAVTKSLELSKDQWQHVSNATFTSNIRQVLQRQWNNNENTSKKISKKSSKVFTSNQLYLYPFLARYNDMLVTTTESSPKLMNDCQQLYLLHLVNHILTSRSRIQRHNKQLKQREEENSKENDDNEKQDHGGGDDDGDEEDDDDDNKFRDQGYTRPTVLVLLPTRGICYQFVHNLLKLVGDDHHLKEHSTTTAGGGGGGKEYMERFETEYGAPPPIEDDDDDDNEDDGGNQKNNNNNKEHKEKEKERRRKEVLESKGEAWLELFGDDVNQDDDFKMGIAITPKAVKKGKGKGSGGKKQLQDDDEGNEQQSNVSVKLYSDFYKSDIIVASPLGLKILANPTGDGDDDDDAEDVDMEGDGKDKQGDLDYLSSIEICLVQNADFLMMQNWDHVNDVLSFLNQQPQKNNDTDFSRVRNYFLDGHAMHWRQLIISSNIIDPSIMSTFTRFATSCSGSVKMRRRVAPEDASISSVLLPLRHVFQRVTTSSLERQSDARISYFTKSILPQILRSKQTHTMVYIPSYFDFCSLRNIFLKRNLPFVSVTEYSRHTETSRGRARFLQGRKPIMLYTGRCHFFHRHAMKGVKHLIFLGLPEHGQYYADHVNGMSSNSSSSNTDDYAGDAAMATTTCSCLALFTKYDAHALERLVGTSNCQRMVRSDKSTFMFYS